MNSLIIFLYLLSFLIIWQFVGYPLLMAIVAITSKPQKKDYTYTPFVSILVATYNEEKVIERRIKNLFKINYPNDKYEILVVDSGSTDRTAKIVEKFIGQLNTITPNIQLIKEDKRRGKASAINMGKRYAHGDILLIADANSIFDDDVLKEIMPHFRNPNVGGVSGRYSISNPDQVLSSSEAFYWELECIMSTGESYLDSVSTVIGTISAWRINLMNFRSATITEDLDMTIQIRRRGHKIKYEPHAIVYEQSATTTEDQIMQRKRTSIGTIQNMFKHGNYFMFPRDLYSILIFPSHKSLTMLSPFIFIAIIILYFAIWDINSIISHFILNVSIFTGMFILLIFFKSRLNMNVTITSTFSIFSIAKIVYYVLLNEYLILLAWKDFILRRHSILWEKAESTRGD